MTARRLPDVDMTWRLQGACRGLDAGLFYPITEEEADPAKQVCGQCAVENTCLEYALGFREKEGVWGGTTEKERRRIVRQRRRQRTA